MATPIPSNVARFELTEVARITGGALLGDDVHIRGISTDTRAVRAGELFVALRGEAFEAHAFLAEALRSGAAALLVADAGAVPEGASAVVVDDTLVALGQLAHAHRRRWGRRVVGVTGSAGKTTTKELLVGALEAVGEHVLATSGNLNNRVGVPMTLFGLDESHTVAVIEMGTSEVGEIAKLAAIACPDVSMITSIGLSHAEGIGNIDDVAVEKGAIFRALAPGGIAVVNLDDPRVVAEACRIERIVSYGKQEGASIRLVSCALDDSGATLEVAYPDQHRPLRTRVGIPSAVAALNATGALAVVAALGASIETAAAGLASRRVDGRMTPIELASGVLVLDDTYNANPRSMDAALESSASLARGRGGRLLLVLGDMRELGAHSMDAHAELGALVARFDAARFVGVGTEMSHAVSRAAQLGVHVTRAEESSSPGLVDALGSLDARDVILVKGSRSMRMERVVQSLRDAGGTP